MKNTFQFFTVLISFGLIGICFPLLAADPNAPQRKTAVTIRGEDFYINDRPTYAGRIWQGHRIEGLLLNARMVQGIFDDLNPETINRWIYPDTGKWDAGRAHQAVVWVISGLF